MTWLYVSALGLSSTGFMRAWGAVRAARACRYCARPISSPSGVTAALLLMFCALNGATRAPGLAHSRHSAAVRNDLPGSLVQPRSMRGRDITVLFVKHRLQRRPITCNPPLLDACDKLVRHVAVRKAQPRAGRHGRQLEGHLRHVARLPLAGVPGLDDLLVRHQLQIAASDIAVVSHD